MTNFQLADLIILNVYLVIYALCIALKINYYNYLRGIDMDLLNNIKEGLEKVAQGFKNTSEEIAEKVEKEVLPAFKSEAEKFEQDVKNKADEIGEKLEKEVLPALMSEVEKFDQHLKNEAEKFDQHLKNEAEKFEQDTKKALDISTGLFVGLKENTEQALQGKLDPARADIDSLMHTPEAWVEAKRDKGNQLNRETLEQLCDSVRSLDEQFKIAKADFDNEIKEINKKMDAVGQDVAKEMLPLTDVCSAILKQSTLNMLKIFEAVTINMKSLTDNYVEGSDARNDAMQRVITISTDLLTIMDPTNLSEVATPLFTNIVKNAEAGVILDLRKLSLLLSECQKNLAIDVSKLEADVQQSHEARPETTETDAVNLISKVIAKIDTLISEVDEPQDEGAAAATTLATTAAISEVTDKQEEAEAAPTLATAAAAEGSEVVDLTQGLGKAAPMDVQQVDAL